MIFESKKLTCVYTQLNSNSLCLSLKKNPTVPARRFALIPIVGNQKYWNESHSFYSNETCLFIGLQELEIEIN